MRLLCRMAGRPLDCRLTRRRTGALPCGGHSAEFEEMFGSRDYYIKLKEDGLHGKLRNKHFRSICWRVRAHRRGGRRLGAHVGGGPVDGMAW